jgi:hypothetical protein
MEIESHERNNHKVGYFVFSLDTERVGEFVDQPPSKRSSRDGSTERKTIQRLLDMIDVFGVVATWDITGHLFYEKVKSASVSSWI